MSGQIKVVTFRDEKTMLQNPWYKKYWERKQEIKQKYPPIKQMTRLEHHQYMKEIGDMIWEQDGPFQEFMWENISEVGKVQMDRKARGRRKNASDENY